MLTRRSLRGALGLIVACTLFQGGPAKAVGPTLLGYTGSARADGLHAFYTPQGVLPIPPLIDIGSPDALASIASGPSTFARASAADPGDLLNNPDVLLAAAISGYKAGTVPQYPYRVEASSGYGAPVSESSPAPGLDAKAAVDGSSSTATATSPQLGVPGVATLGSMRSIATTTTDGSTVAVTAHSEISSFNLVGLLSIDSIVTDLRATSDGATTSVSGGTTVTGAKVLGRPVTIGPDGVQSDATSPPSASGNPLSRILGGLGLGGASAAVDPNEALQLAGITVTLAEPVQTGNAAASQITSAGLRIDLELSRDTQPQLEQLIDMLPSLGLAIPGAISSDDIVALVQAKHLSYIALGQGSALLTSSQYVARAPVASASAAPTATSKNAATSTGASSPSAAARAAAAAPTAPTLVAADADPVAVGAGVGALLAMVLLALPALGDRLAQGVRAITARDAASTCGWEER